MRIAIFSFLLLFVVVVVVVAVCVCDVMNKEDPCVTSVDYVMIYSFLLLLLLSSFSSPILLPPPPHPTHPTPPSISLAKSVTTGMHTEMK